MSTDLPTIYYIPRRAALELWITKRRACPNLAADAAKCAGRWYKMQNTATDGANQHGDQVSKSRRGRPPVTLENPVFTFMPILHRERPGWFDDIVYGSIASSAGTHRAQLNVRISDVCAALHLKVIAAASIRRPYMSDRSAQSIAQATRNAAKGIAHYLYRHPQVHAHLCKEYEQECAAWDSLN